MKPDWDDAPKWAKWLAMDSDGDWYWYESSPTWDYVDSQWSYGAGNRIMFAGSTIHPSKTLEQRN